VAEQAVTGYGEFSRCHQIVDNDIDVDRVADVDGCRHGYDDVAMSTKYSRC